MAKVNPDDGWRADHVTVRVPRGPVSGEGAYDFRQDTVEVRVRVGGPQPVLGVVIPADDSGLRRAVNRAGRLLSRIGAGR